MGKKQSSFHMGNEFNGYGEKTYLKATECGIHLPVSQENVRLTPDFRNCLLPLLGSVPVVIDPAKINPVFMSLIGSMASVNRTIITKDEQTGRFCIQFKVRSSNFSTGSSLNTVQIMDNEVPLSMGIKDQWVQDGINWKYYQNQKFLKSSWLEYEDKWYYLDSNEYMVTGLQVIDGKAYYFRSRIEAGTEMAGYMVTHWEEIEGDWYYFHSTGEMIKLDWAQDEAKKHWYYCDADGKMVTSRIIDWKGKKYYVEEDGAMAVSKTIVDPESGKSYKADGDGVLTEGTVNAGAVYAIPLTDAKRLTNGQQEANAEYIYNYLFNKGCTKEAICGLLGNIQQESQLNPGVWQDQNNTNLGYGLVQWDDATKFLNWANLSVNATNAMAKNNPTQLLDLQLDYLIWSSETSTSSSVREWFPTTSYGSPYRMFYEDFIISTHDVGDLALVFHGSYERSADDATRKQNRINYAKKWYTYFSK